MSFTLTHKVSPEIKRLAEKVSGRLINEVMPSAFAEAVPLVRKAIQDELPDGDKTGNSAKRSKASKARFPRKMNQSVSVKHIADNTGVLKLVGVDSRGAHVNFDHGEKARTTGRLHKLWWIDGVREKFHEPKLRKQQYDIPKIVKRKVGSKVERIMVSHIKQAAESGKLVK
jgi:hypothetical protein